MNRDEIFSKIKELNPSTSDSYEVKQEKYQKIMNILFGIKNKALLFKEFTEDFSNENIVGSNKEKIRKD